LSSSQKLGKLIRMSRERMKLKQEELAERIDVSRAHISQLEIGKAGKINEYELHQLAEALHEDEDTLREAAGLAPLGEPSNIVTIPAHWGKHRREMLKKLMRFIENEIDDDEEEEGQEEKGEGKGKED
jgi:transcriptional regulator with XRE-family HTH domain